MSSIISKPNDPAQGQNPLDGISRQRWSVAAASILCQQPIEAIHAMAARGFDEFVRISAPIFNGHGFKQSDYQRMFALIVRCSRANASPTMGQIQSLANLQ